MVPVTYSRTSEGYFSPPLGLEPSKKFVVVGGGGGGWCLKANLAIGFGPNLGLGTWTLGQADHK